MIKTDVSNIAIGVVLSQEGHPIPFFSKKLCPKMQASSVYVKEMLAITKSSQKATSLSHRYAFHSNNRPTKSKGVTHQCITHIETTKVDYQVARIQF